MPRPKVMPNLNRGRKSSSDRTMSDLSRRSHIMSAVRNDDPEAPVSRILLCYFSWRNEHIPLARKRLMAYCQLCADREIVADAQEFFNELCKVSKSAGAAKIERTYLDGGIDGYDIENLFGY